MGDRQEYLSKAVTLINETAGKVVSLSDIYESEPWGFEHPVWFLNQVISIETDDEAGPLLEKLQHIERLLDRVRFPEYQARTIDIDILFYGDRIINLPGLIIPHPLISSRKFVLQPLAELIPDYVHPVLHRTIKYLNDHCSDASGVMRYEL